MSNELAFSAAVALFFLYYFPSLRARLSAPRGREEHLASKLLMYAVYSFFFLLSFSSFPSAGTFLPFFSFAGILLALAGVLLHWRAISSLGGAYAAGTEFKPGQKLVTTGVFSFCRHPVYSAAGLFFLGLALLLLTPASLAAYFLVLAYLSYRMRVEEKFLRKKFGKEYDAYSKKVPATILGRSLIFFSKKLQ